MPTFSESDDLRGARFVGADLSEAVMRGVQITGADIDAPWLLEGDGSLWVNGVDVVPFVEAELNRRFPGRSLRRATDPDGLRAAWSALEGTWERTLARALAMPTGTVDVSVAGEWSFAQTLRHLVLATDMWLGRGVLEIAQPFHPIGQVDTQSQGELESFATVTPSFDEVLEVRAGRTGMVRDFLATVTPEELAASRRNPHNPEFPETTLSCLHVILEEEWEHHRYAVRDLDVIASRP
ncbi:DinB family protein [Lentzea sp. HUAS TT2]|uniref:DinB family protein n=1 Tax=Lentzea sp. HUAS TT2 TaxID=3447454 RepID=UPI003F71E6D0